jgi:hypothetical protein
MRSSKDKIKDTTRESRIWIFSIILILFLLLWFEGIEFEKTGEFVFTGEDLVEEEKMIIDWTKFFLFSLPILLIAYSLTKNSDYNKNIVSSIKDISGSLGEGFFDKYYMSFVIFIAFPLTMILVLIYILRIFILIIKAIFGYL